MRSSTANDAMTPETYLRRELAGLANRPAPPAPSDMPGEICRLLLSHHFRKYAVPASYRAHIASAVASCVSRQIPVRLTLVFGGYKLWRLEEAPEPDWAELFALLYYADWLAPVAAVYPPGVWFDFYSDDVILEEMDNITPEETGRYLAGFRSLLSWIRPYLPDNIAFTLNRVADQYEDVQVFRNELADNRRSLLEHAGLPVLTDEQLRLVELNVRPVPGQERDPQWRERVFLTHEAYARVSRRRPYYRTPDKIFVSTRAVPDSIAVGTTKSSVVKFWIGTGALEPSGDSFVPRILSPHQLAMRSYERVPVALDNMSGKNFTTIRVLRV